MAKQRFYVKCLAGELARRKVKNARYSLRRFAHQLGIDPSALSRILNGKQELSLQSAVKVSQKLALPLDQKRQFLLSVAEDQMDQVTSILSEVIDLPLSLVTSWKMSEHGGSTTPEYFSYTADRLSVMSKNGTYLYLNPVATATLSKLTGIPLTTQDLIGRSAHELGVPEEINLPLRGQERVVFDSGQPDVRVLTFNTEKDVVCLERCVSPIFGKNGQVDAVISVARDVTARRKLEMERDRLLRYAKANQKIAASLLPTLTREQIVANFFEVITQEVGASSGAVYFLSEGDHQLTVIYEQNGSALTSIPLESESLSAECFRIREAIWLNRVDAATLMKYSYSAGLFRKKGTASAAALPLIANGKAFGVICLCFPVAHHFDPQEREFLMTVGDLCAVALERARLFENERTHRRFDPIYARGVPDMHLMEMEPF